MTVALGLIGTAALIGLTGGVHCVAMCASPCALAVPPQATLAFQAGRLLGYAGLGAAAALGAAAFSEMASLAVWVRPLWLMTHVGMLVLGAWMLFTGHQPRVLQEGLLLLARALPARRPAMLAAGAGTAAMRRPPCAGVPSSTPARPYRRAFVTGLAWSLLPCGLLYSVVMLAWMGGNVVNGMLIMAAFASVSGVQLWLGQRGFLALISRRADQAAMRLAGAVTLVGAGLLLGLAATGHAPDGFCLPR